MIHTTTRDLQRLEGESEELVSSESDGVQSVRVNMHIKGQLCIVITQNNVRRGV